MNFTEYKGDRIGFRSFIQLNVDYSYKNRMEQATLKLRIPLLTGILVIININEVEEIISSQFS